MVLDVSHWKMEVGNTVNFVGGQGLGQTIKCCGGATVSTEITKASGGGRDWSINDDGTISAKVSGWGVYYQTIHTIHDFHHFTLLLMSPALV